MFTTAKAVSLVVLGAILKFAVTTGHIAISIADVGMVLLIVGGAMLVLPALPHIAEALTTGLTKVSDAVTGK